jgi:hypothetical protein
MTGATMTRRMSAGLQGYNIGTILAGTRWDNQQFDIHAHIDRSLHYDENVKNIRGILGIQTRQRGVEAIHQHEQERQREHTRRLDTTRQTGQIQNAHNQALDAMLHALHPGRRMSATGHIYYERRENRSDKNWHERL